MKKMRLLSVIMALAMVMTVFTACTTTPQSQQTDLAQGGTLLLKVNPEIAISYDEAGLVTAVSARNPDAQALLEGYTGFEGKETKIVITELVEKIGSAGYFVEEIEGERKQIVIEIEKGSAVPNPEFMDGVVNSVKESVKNNKWYNPIDITNESLYGITDYIDTDYGPGNDGITDYIDTDYGRGNDGVTDYHDTDYGYKHDGVTDYDDSPYDKNSVTDYDDTDYGPHNDGITDYDTDYGVTDYGKKPAVKPDAATTSTTPATPATKSDTSSTTPNTPSTKPDTSVKPGKGTDYGKTDYTDYHAPKATPKPTPKPEQKPAHTDYGKTDYGKTDYGKSDYGRSDYRDSDYH